MLLLNTGKGVKPFALWTFPGGRSCGDTVDTGWTPLGCIWLDPSPWWNLSYAGGAACVADWNGSSDGGREGAGTRWISRDNMDHSGQTQSHWLYKASKYYSRFNKN